jgi:hypothetical protein
MRSTRLKFAGGIISTALTTLVLAMPGTAVAQEPPFIEISRVPITGEFFNECTGEVVSVEGYIQFTNTYVFDETGARLYNTHATTHLSGVGLTSGATYTVTQTQFQVTGVRPAETITGIFKTRITAPGPGNDLVITLVGHFMIDANGQVHVIDFRFSEGECT